jgi:hypothetical protein
VHVNGYIRVFFGSVFREEALLSLSVPAAVFPKKNVESTDSILWCIVIESEREREKERGRGRVKKLL